MATLMIGYHPPELGEKDIAGIIALGFRGWDAAPTFCGWLVALLQAEQIRRLQVERRTYLEVELAALPLDWSDSQLGQSLVVCTALSYGAPSYEAGKFIDKLMIALTGLIASRLQERR